MFEADDNLVGSEIRRFGIADYEIRDDLCLAANSFDVVGRREPARFKLVGNITIGDVYSIGPSKSRHDRQCCEHEGGNRPALLAPAGSLVQILAI